MFQSILWRYNHLRCSAGKRGKNISKTPNRNQQRRRARHGTIFTEDTGRQGVRDMSGKSSPAPFSRLCLNSLSWSNTISWNQSQEPWIHLCLNYFYFQGEIWRLYGNHTPVKRTENTKSFFGGVGGGMSISLCNSSSPGTHYLDQGSLKLIEIPLSLSPGLKAWTTAPD